MGQIIKSFGALRTILSFAVVIKVNGLQQLSILHSCYMSVMGLVFTLSSCLMDQPSSGPMPILYRREKREMRSHISQYFSLEITHITLAHIPLAFVFNKIGKYNPPAWAEKRRGSCKSHDQAQHQEGRKVESSAREGKYIFRTFNILHLIILRQLKSH